MLSVDRTKSRHYGDEQGRYWSVSQVCQVVTGKDGSQYAAGAADRGTDLHLIFALALGHYAGYCDPPDVDEAYIGYHMAMLDWMDWAKPTPMKIEDAYRHKTLPYAGTPDCVGMIGEAFGVLDLKTGQPERWHAMQVRAYKEMVEQAAKMWVLYVKNDGTFQFKDVKSSARDWAAFQSGLNLLQWREA
jgi:hypothetical protein